MHEVAHAGCEEQPYLGLCKQVIQLKRARAQEDIFRGLLRARWRVTWRLLVQSSRPHLHPAFLHSKGCSCNAGSNLHPVLPGTW